MKLLLDTHVFIWLASDMDQLSNRARDAISRNAGRLHISSITGLEVALAWRRGRLTLPLAPADFVARALHQHGIQEIPVTADIGCRAALLPDIHNDPFDRILIATALANEMIVLTKDAVMTSYPGVKTDW